MSTVRRDLFIGITALGGLVVLAWMLLRFGELAGVGQTFDTIVLRVESARGVSSVSPVSFNGVRVGDVTSIELADDGSGDALIALRVREGIGLPAEFDVFLDASFVGEAVLDLVAVPDAAANAIEGDGEVYPVEITSLAGNLTSNLAKRLAAFDRATASIEELAETYTDVGRRLSAVIDSDESDAGDLRSLLERADRVVTRSEAWVAEDGLLEDVRGSVARFDEVAQRVADEAGAFAARSSRSLDRADAAIVTADEAVSELRTIAARINRGEGTLGQLATNPDLYNSMTAAIQQFQSLITEARLLVEKFRDEGIPISL
ncbi:MAG: MlaD family protein [Planctomycetota bacterium]